MGALAGGSLLQAAPAPRQAFSSPPARSATCRRQVVCSSADRDGDPAAAKQPGRRQALAGAVLLAAGLAQGPAQAVIKGYEPMPALEGKDYGKPRMTYSDYEQSESGLQFTDIKVGTGVQPQKGQTCVVDWAGVTIGYYGRPFEARNKPKGGAFAGDDKEFFRFKLGEGAVIPAFDEAVAGMRVGGIRRIIVPVELGYPDNDMNKLGPKPTTFSGQRALDFVLKNQGLIDKTLLMDIELVAVRD